MRNLLIATLTLVGMFSNVLADFNSGLAAYNKDNYQVAFEEFKPLAEKGDAEAQYYFGLMFDEGKLPKSYLEKEKQYFFIGDKKIYSKRDSEKAFKWLEKSAIQGHSKAQYQLGLMYNQYYYSWWTSYISSAKDSNLKAIKWWTKSAKQGNVDAQTSLAILYGDKENASHDYKKAFKWTKKAAENGELYSTLGDMYHGGLGTEKNYKKAIKWWGKSADKGSIYSLNKLLEDNLKDYMSKSDRLKWVKKAANNGSTYYQIELGLLYDADKNYKKAVYWFKKAAEQGDKVAQFNVGNMYSQGQGVLKDFEQAFKWYKKSAEQGFYSAQLNLGAYYIDGKGTSKDLHKARYWTKKAYENPDANAKTIEKAKYNWENNELWKYSNSTKVDKNSDDKSKYSKSGTGFIVDKSGHILTNNHVINNCSTIKVNNTTVSIKSTDANNDIALLQGKPSSSIAYFRSGRGVRLGEDVTITGYPLRSILGSGLNAVTGTVSSLSGVKNNTSQFQITAPVNSGNSGGPVLDSSGNIVGIVVSKINKKDVQGVGFAIKSSTARDFLDINNVDYEVAKSKSKLSNVDIVDKAKDFTVLIKCWE